MSDKSSKGVSRGVLVAFLVLGALTVLAILPYQYGLAANNKDKATKGLFQRTVSKDEGIENYDIRIEKSETTAAAMANFRQASGKSAVAVADTRDNFVKGENDLKARVPTLKIEYNPDLRSPEVIGPDVDKGRAMLTGRSKVKHADILRNFIKENNNLLGVTGEQADDLVETADYTNPDGNLSYARLEQRINGIPVFRGEANAGFTRNGEMFRIINNIAPGLDYKSLSTDFGDPAEALRAAAAYIAPPGSDTGTNDRRTASIPRLNERDSTDLKAIFGEGDFANTAEKMYFPTEPGVARAAWRVLIWQAVNSYYVIVDAETGTMLWRKNLTADQTQSATYNVYTNPANMVNISKNPAPIIPGLLDPGLGTQGSVIARNSVTLIGNEVPNTFNSLGWITDGNNTTDGNNVQAGLDRKLPNTGNPANPSDIDSDGMATGSPTRVFNFAYNPGDPSTGTGDAPLPVGQAAGTCLGAADVTLPTNFQKGITTQLFYINNRYHDEMYKLGFTEAARNFQNDNFGRGGNAADRVSAQAQDCSGTNNANFTTPADGTRGTMQMYLFTGPTPNYDGSIDADIVIHEHTHGLSNRLIFNGSGLTNNRGGSMGEGWSDFYGLSLLSNPATPLASNYTTGDWATYKLTASYTYNYYYGIRRFPYAIRSFTGGALNRPYNPLTLADIDPAQASIADGAFAANPTFAGNAANEVHNAGEVWCEALLEVRSRFILRVGAAQGNLKTLQLVTDGMKLTPSSPNFISARDAIIQAAQASAIAPEASVDVADVREGFRIHGMGFGATDGGTAVVESFVAPNAVATNPITISDSTGDNDGFPEPGENILLTVPVTNPSTGATITNVFANINGGTNVSYGSIADTATVTHTIPFTVPAGTACGSDLTININVTSDAGTQAPFPYTFKVGVPVGGAPVTFTSAVPVRIPGGTATVGVADVYPTTLVVSGLTGNKTISLELTNLSTTYPGDLDMLLVGPGGQKFVIMSDVVSAFTTQTNAVVVLKDSAATVLPAAGTTNMNGSWKPTDQAGGVDAWAAPAPTAPYLSPAPTGTATFTSVFGTASAGLNGTWSLYAVDDVSGDFTTITGWKLTFDAADYTCSVVTAAGVTVSGRVLTTEGRGLRNAMVRIADQSGNVRTVATGPLGFYHFDEVESGQSYVVSVIARRFSYAPKVVQISDNVSDLDFVPSQ